MLLWIKAFAYTYLNYQKPLIHPQQVRPAFWYMVSVQRRILKERHP